MIRIASASLLYTIPSAPHLPSIHTHAKQYTNHSAPEGVPPLEEDAAAVLRPELIMMYVRTRVMTMKQKIVAVSGVGRLVGWLVGSEWHSKQ
jgi:hypothetical protein